MGDPELIEIIRAEIAARGPISFARFIELALYEPQHGYYSSGRAAIGRRGDFFTNVSVGPVFGQLLAIQFAEVWEKLGRPSHFTIIEHGADDGAFAQRSRSTKPRSRIRARTTLRATRAANRSLQGDKRFGLLNTPASVAHSASDISRAGLLK